jgi:hypothetical protein
MGTKAPKGSVIARIPALEDEGGGRPYSLNPPLWVWGPWGPREVAEEHVRRRHERDPLTIGGDLDSDVEVHTLDEGGYTQVWLVRVEMALDYKTRPQVRE